MYITIRQDDVRTCTDIGTLVSVISESAYMLRTRTLRPTDTRTAIARLGEYLGTQMYTDAVPSILHALVTSCEARRDVTVLVA